MPPNCTEVHSEPAIPSPTGGKPQSQGSTGEHHTYGSPSNIHPTIVVPVLVALGRFQSCTRLHCSNYCIGGSCQHSGLFLPSVVILHRNNWDSKFQEKLQISLRCFGTATKIGLTLLINFVCISAYKLHFIWLYSVLLSFFLSS